MSGEECKISACLELRCDEWAEPSKPWVWAPREECVNLNEEESLGVWITCTYDKVPSTMDTVYLEKQGGRVATQQYINGKEEKSG